MGWGWVGWAAIAAHPAGGSAAGALLGSAEGATWPRAPIGASARRSARREGKPSQNEAFSLPGSSRRQPASKFFVYHYYYYYYSYYYYYFHYMIMIVVIINIIRIITITIIDTIIFIVIIIIIITIIL